MSATVFVMDGEVLVSSPYDAAAVADLKERFPSYRRRWDPNLRAWAFRPLSLMDDVLDWARLHYDVVELDESARAHAQVPPPRGERGPARRADRGDPYHDMLAQLPDDVLKKVYRCIAAEVHPDRGGDGRLMQVVNDAWARIEARRGA